MQRQTSTVNASFTVSEIVRSNYRTADVFKYYGINYCCGGNVTLEEACSLNTVNLPEITEALDKATSMAPSSAAIQYGVWKPEFLIDYLVNIHHAYLHQTLPTLSGTLVTFVEGHKKKFPHLAKLPLLFNQLAQLLKEQNEKEETAVFPYLKQLINAYNRKETYGSLFVKTMRLPLHHMLDKEHKQVSDLLLQIRKETQDYTVPENGCTNYGVIIHKLAELDADLVQHKHLENNFLFPKVLEMEKELLQL
jgi:regulator of cell morphogenesis and NO signaling